MADITKTIDPDAAGADYASISAWDAAEQTDLVTATNTHTVTLSNISDSADTSTSVDISGNWAVNATYTLDIIVNPTYRHDGTRGTGYRYIPSTNYDNSLELMLGCTVDGLAVSSSSANSYNGIYAGNTELVEVTNCLIYDMVRRGIYLYSGSVIANCITVGNTLEGILAGGTSYVANCTSIGNGQGIEAADYSTVTIKNCYAGGNTTNDFYENANSTTHCYNCMAADTSFADIAFNTESNCSDSVTYNTTNLTNVTATSEDPKLPSGSGLIDGGIDIDGDASWPTECETTGDGNDFEATLRGATWDVGAHEYVAAGGSTILPWITAAYVG